MIEQMTRNSVPNFETVSDSNHAKGEKAIEAIKSLSWPVGTELESGPKGGKNARKPDLTVTFPNGPIVPLEVKLSKNGISGIRPLDYRTTIIWRPGATGAGEWWVIPPHDMLRLAAEFSGQGCQSSFESFNPGSPPKPFDIWKCEKANVPIRVKEAFEEGEKSSLKSLRVKMQHEIIGLYYDHIKRVQSEAPLSVQLTQRRRLNVGKHSEPVI